MHAGAAAVDRRDQGLVLVSGPDTWSFLQALVSADLDALADGDGALSLLLTPQGKLGVRFRVLRVGDDAWLDCDPGMAAELAAMLVRFKIRVKVDVIDRSDVMGLWSLIGPDAVPAFEAAAGIRVPEQLHHHVGWGSTRVVRTEWAGVPGADLVGLSAELEREGAAGSVPSAFDQAGPAAFDAFRIECGVAQQPADLPEGTIPQEAFLERDAVSFTKGCFLGQELVCRIDTRGHVNRFLRRLTCVAGDVPPPGAAIVFEGKTVGSVTSVSPPVATGHALGYVRREVQPPTPVELEWDGGRATAMVETLLSAP